MTNPFARRKASEDDYTPRRSEDAYAGVGRRSEDAYAGVGRSSEDTQGGGPFGAKRKGSQDTPPPRRSDERDRRPPSNDSSTGGGVSTGMTVSGMIIPNKSTIAEEEIEVPYGQAQRDRDTVSGMSVVGMGRDGEDTDGEDLRSPKIALGGLSGLTARLRGASVDEEGGGTRSGGEDYYDKMSLGRASVGSDRSTGVPVAGLRLNSNARGEDAEKMRREYEYKIATMQSRIAGLERDLGGAADERDARSDLHREERERGESKVKEGEERVRAMEEELVGLRRVCVSVGSSYSEY